MKIKNIEQKNDIKNVKKIKVQNDFYFRYKNNFVFMLILYLVLAIAISFSVAAAGNNYIKAAFLCDEDGLNCNDLSNGLSAGGWTASGGDVYLTTVSDNVGIGITAPDQKLEVKGVFGIQRSIADVTSTIDNEGNFNFDATNSYNFVFKGNGVERLRIENGGNVGIGTNDPSSNLHVSGTGGLLTIGDSSFSDHYLSFRDNSEYGVFVGMDVSANSGRGALLIQGGNAKSIDFVVNESGGYGTGTPDMIISEGGNVGIGTSTPRAPLDIPSGANQEMIALQYNSISTHGGGYLVFGANARKTDNSAHYAEFENTIANSGVSMNVLSVISGLYQHGGNAVAGTKTNLSDFNNVLNWDSSGRIGIGTNTPSSELEIEGSVNGEVALLIDNLNTDSGAYSSVIIQTADSGTGYFAIADPEISAVDVANRVEILSSAGAEGISIAADGSGKDIRFYSGGRSNERMRIDGDGYVGIGTTSPSSPLTIQDPIISEVFINRTGGKIGALGAAGTGTYIGYDSSGYLDIATITGAVASGYDAKIRVTGSGNVGIGTTSPDGKLDVRGLIKGGFGAANTGGILNWSDPTNAYAGSGDSLLLGSATDGPNDLAVYYHPFNFEYSSIKSGTSTLTQFAIPYGASNSLATGMYARGRYSDTWSDWYRFLVEDPNGNVGIGTTVPDSKIQIKGDFDASSSTGTNDPNKGLVISKYSGIGGDYSVGDLFGIDFTSTSDNDIDYSVAGIYAETNDVASYNGGSLHFLTKQKTDASLQKRMIIDKVGNVGIGTTNPSVKLEIGGNSPLLFTTNGSYGAAISSNTNASALLLSGGTGNTDGPAIELYGGNHSLLPGRIYMNYGGYNTTIGSFNLRFYDGAVFNDVFHANYDGNVGIGITSPLSKLHVNGAVQTSRLGTYGTYNSAEVQGIWSINQQYPINTGSDTFGTQYGMGYAYSTNGGAPFGSQHQFVFTNAGVIGAAITFQGYGYFGGNVGIGKRVPTVRLDINNTLASVVVQVADSSNTCSFGVDASGWVPSCSSDERLKDDILVSDSVLDKLMGLKIKQFDWKSNGEHVDYGLIAQELNLTNPEMVDLGEDGFYKVNSVSTMELTKAIQEQQEQLDKKDMEVLELKAQNDLLKEAICEINPNANVCE